MAPEIRSFLEGLLRDAGMKPVDEAMQEEMISELFARLDNHITTTIVDNLPEDKIEKFIQMNEEKKDRGEIEAFLKENVDDYQDVFQGAFVRFRDMYLGNVAVSRNAPHPKQEDSESDRPDIH